MKKFAMTITVKNMNVTISVSGITIGLDIERLKSDISGFDDMVIMLHKILTVGEKNCDDYRVEVLKEIDDMFRTPVLGFLNTLDSETDCVCSVEVGDDGKFRNSMTGSFTIDLLSYAGFVKQIYSL